MKLNNAILVEIQWEPEDYQTSIELIGCDIVDENSPTTTKQRVELSVD